MILPLWDSVIVLCVVMRYFVSILSLKHLDGEERAVLFCLFYLPCVSGFLCGSFSWCQGFACGFVIVVFPDHTHLLFNVMSETNSTIFHLTFFYCQVYCIEIFCPFETIKNT